MSEHEQRLEDLKVITEVLEDIYPGTEVSAMMVEEIPPEPADSEGAK